VKVTFPHMGGLWVVAKTVLEDLGLEVVVPPRPNRRSLEVGVRHCPEFACFPLKLNIGDLVAAIERGADTIIMAGGVGPCRFGHYAQVQAQILRDLGYRVDMVVLEPPHGHFEELRAKIRRLTGGKPLSRVVRALAFGWWKLKALDELDRALAAARVCEGRRGEAAGAHRRAVAAVEAAGDKTGVRRALDEGLQAIRATAESGWRDRDAPALLQPLSIGLVGEVFMVAEPFANQEIERRLGELGVLVRRSLYLSDWVRTNLFPRALQPARRRHCREVQAAARPYLGHFVGGEGLDTVGETVLFGLRGCDGVIQVAPFTCMPEIVAASLLPEVGRDLGLPVLSLFLDEHTGEAGLQTRLEAFVDLIARRTAHPATCGPGGAGRAGGPGR